MKYICPTCGNGFSSEEEIKQHSLICWRKNNPDYKSTPAPQGEDVNKSFATEEVLDFFKSFGE